MILLQNSNWDTLRSPDLQMLKRDYSEDGILDEDVNTSLRKGENM